MNGRSAERTRVAIKRSMQAVFSIKLTQERYVANWTKHTHRLILAHSVHILWEHDVIHKTGK